MQKRAVSKNVFLYKLATGERIRMDRFSCKGKVYLKDKLFWNENSLNHMIPITFVGPAQACLPPSWYCPQLQQSMEFPHKRLCILFTEHSTVVHKGDAHSVINCVVHETQHWTDIQGNAGENFHTVQGVWLALGAASSIVVSHDILSGKLLEQVPLVLFHESTNCKKDKDMFHLCYL